MRIKRLTAICTILCASLIVAFTATPSHAQSNEGLTNQELLSWSPENQENYFKISVAMLTFVAAQTNKSRCVSDWYFSDISSRNKYIQEVLREYPAYHPSGTILTLIQKSCGSITQ